jgi:hypothetical protein
MIMEKIRNVIINISLSLFMLFFATELFSFFSYKYSILPINIGPSYLINNGIKWRNENSPWGAWHKKNYTDKNTKSCFDVTYKTNNLGARDVIDYDQNLSSNSIILIGDSFAEGYGVSINNSFAKWLEKFTGKTILNFGTAGSFGPVQQEIIYRKLANPLPHSELIQFFLPANDFTESSIKYWQNDLHRYRPYFKKNSSGNYSIIYPEQAVKSQDFDIKNQPNTWIEKVARMTFSLNIYRNLKLLLNKYEKRQVKSNYDSYFFNDNETIKGTLFFVDKLLKHASNLTKRTLVIIPALIDMDKISEGKNYQDLNWYRTIKTITKNTDTQLIDLAEHIPLDNYKKLFFDCDHHWSPEGNKWAAKVVKEQAYASKFSKENILN